jgi:hypothetical protein
MDEHIFFDRFHEALEMEPRPGAYDRMRHAFTNQSVARKSGPLFRMRWTKMGLRVAAGLTAVIVAIALLAVFIATHNPPVGNIPASQDTKENVTAYENLNRADDVKMNVAVSNHCVTIADPGCAAAVLVVDAALQQWTADLNGFNTPSRFVVLDGELRTHLGQAIKELNATVSFQKNNNVSAFNMAIGAASYEHDWINYAATALEASPGVASKYRSAVGFAKQSFDSCTTCGALPARACLGASAQSCEDDVQSAEFQTQAFLIAVLSNPAPSALTAKDARLKADLAAADTALLAITNGLLSGDSGAVQAGQRSFSSAIGSVAADASAISNS